MSADWQIGDLAVCVDAGVLRCPVGTPHTGASAPPLKSCKQVSRICTTLDLFPYADCNCLTLCFADGSYGIARRFRKIRPDEHKSCEPEFVQLLKRSRKRVSA